MKLNSFDDWLKKSYSIKEDSLEGTDADNYAKEKGLAVKAYSNKEKSELINGGPIDSTMIDIVYDLEKSSGFEFIITGGNDEYHQDEITTYKSRHTIGKAIDINSPSLKLKSNRLKLERAILDLIKLGKYNKNGLRLGGINEYDNPTAKATGPHFHLSLSSDAPSNDRKELNLALLGITSYASIRNNNVDITKNNNIKYDISTSDNSRVKIPSTGNRKYYKIYDHENKRMLIAKYKGNNTFKIYNRKRDKIGVINKSDNTITYNSNDITATKLGIIFIELFKQLESNNMSTKSSNNHNLNAGVIKHNYSGEQANNISIIEQSAKEHGITNANSIIGLLSVLGKESQFVPKSELSYNNTSNDRIRSVFSSRLGNKTDAEINSLKANSELFFNTVYDGLYGNGQNEGYKYRGRGFNQLTFKGSYEKYGRLIGKDLVNNPDILNDTSVAAEVAIKFLLNRLREKNIDPNSFSNSSDALKSFAAANAGWNKDPNAAIAKAEKIKPNFSLA